jgi:hypothetical protein
MLVNARSTKLVNIRSTKMMKKIFAIVSIRDALRNRTLVMAGLDPAIHVFLFRSDKNVDARDKPGHDSEFVEALTRSVDYAWLATVLPSAAWAAARRAIGTR